MQLEPQQMRATVWSTVEDSSLRHFSLPLDPTLAGHKSLEEAVYAAPILLSDFARVDVLVRDHRYMAVPSGLPEETLKDMIDYSCLAPDDKDYDLHTDRIDTLDTDIAWPLESSLGGFLARTFRNPHVQCHVSPLLRHFSRRSALGNGGKVYAHLSQCGDTRQADIIILGGNGRLSLAASYDLRGDDDALYYILAGMQQAGLDPRADEVLVCGSGTMREALLARLRRYVAYAMPAIFPSAAFRAGKDALNAPFPLVILPLCE